MQSCRVGGICSQLSLAEVLDQLHLGLLLGLVVGQKVHGFPEAPQVPAVKVLLWALVDES